MVFTVFHQADHGKHIPLAPDLAADGVPAVEEPLGEGLIDDKHAGRFGRVLFGEVAAIQQADAEQIEVAGRNGGAMDHHLLLRGWRVTFDIELVPGRGAGAGGGGHGDYIGVGDADHAGFRLQAFAEDAAEIALLHGRVAGIREIELGHGDVGAIESRLDAAGILEAAVEQSGADERDHGEGHFGDHQHIAQAVGAGTGARAAATFFESFVYIGAGDQQGRHGAGKQRS